ncbi:GPW/gp25 family protein [Chitinivorax sp. B]|uniref:GPW/gp25 family protein n=1 Tax=Chitinivorax sp. B TaxID=2502235 RepID=UPI0010F7DF20|nr:GPW/gp25 family protein [Chitinivorax sp. B]
MNRVAALGNGLALPMTPDTLGQLPQASGPEKVRQSMAVILDTEPGERLMLPTFGCGLRRFLMQPNTTSTRALMQREIEIALRTWEPRISVDRVEVLPGDEPALVMIRIAYTHLRDGRPDNLVYPFYLE